MVSEGGFSGFRSPTLDSAEPFGFPMLFGSDFSAESLILSRIPDFFQIPVFCTAFRIVLDGGFRDFGAATLDFTKPFVL